MVNFMKKISVLAVCLALYIFCVPSPGITENIVTGVIIEHSANNEFIQVGNSIYQVQSVWRDNGVNSLEKINRSYLEVGSVVQIYPGQQTVDYWQAEKVVLMTGAKEGVIANEFELVDDMERLRRMSTTAVKNRRRKKQQKDSVPVFLEDGVWKN